MTTSSLPLNIYLQLTTIRLPFCTVSDRLEDERRQRVLQKYSSTNEGNQDYTSRPREPTRSPRREADQSSQSSRRKSSLRFLESGVELLTSPLHAPHLPSRRNHGGQRHASHAHRRRSSAFDAEIPNLGSAHRRCVPCHIALLGSEGYRGLSRSIDDTARPSCHMPCHTCHATHVSHAPSSLLSGTSQLEPAPG